MSREAKVQSASYDALLLSWLRGFAANEALGLLMAPDRADISRCPQTVRVVN